MSTPRQIRRHVVGQFDQKLLEYRARDWIAGINNPDASVVFACLVSEFEHIEDGMVTVLAGLLGLREDGPARVVYHTLRNPSIKFDILRTLLEHSPTNSGLGPEFDRLLTDYNSVRLQRNRFVHGLWWTDSVGCVFFAQSSLNGLPILDAKEITVERLDEQLTIQREFRRELFEEHVVKLLAGR